MFACLFVEHKSAENSEQIRSVLYEHPFGLCMSTTKKSEKNVFHMREEK
jgi:hypothetical protein